MNGKSSAEIEREAEAARAQVARTAETLRDRMTPGQLVDEAMDYLKNSDSALALDNLKHQARDNPMALALVGTGLVWLMTGSGPTSDARRGAVERTDARNRYPFDDTGTGGAFTGETAPSGWDGFTAEEGQTESGRSMASRAGDAISETAHGARSSAASFGQGVGETMSRTGRGAAEAGRTFQHEIASAAGRTRNTFMDMLDREPLVLGAIGMAVGAAIGAMLPSTRFEDRHFGHARDQMKDEAEDMVHGAVDDAKDVASEAYARTRSAAEEEGLLPHGDEKPLADRIGNTVRAGAEAAEESAEQKLGKATEQPAGQKTGTTTPASPTGAPWEKN